MMAERRAKIQREAEKKASTPVNLVYARGELGGAGSASGGADVGASRELKKTRGSDPAE